jgi:hypothetical protein
VGVPIELSGTKFKPAASGREIDSDLKGYALKKVARYSKALTDDRE